VGRVLGPRLYERLYKQLQPLESALQISSVHHHRTTTYSHNGAASGEHASLMNKGQVKMAEGLRPLPAVHVLLDSMAARSRIRQEVHAKEETVIEHARSLAVAVTKQALHDMAAAQGDSSKEGAEAPAIEEVDVTPKTAPKAAAVPGTDEKVTTDILLVGLWAAEGARGTLRAMRMDVHTETAEMMMASMKPLEKSPTRSARRGNGAAALLSRQETEIDAAHQQREERKLEHDETLSPFSPMVKLAKKSSPSKKDLKNGPVPKSRLRASPTRQKSALSGNKETPEELSFAKGGVEGAGVHAMGRYRMCTRADGDPIVVVSGRPVYKKTDSDVELGEELGTAAEGDDSKPDLHLPLPTRPLGRAGAVNGSFEPMVGGCYLFWCARWGVWVVDDEVSMMNGGLAPAPAPPIQTPPPPPPAGAAAGQKSGHAPLFPYLSPLLSLELRQPSVLSPTALLIAKPPVGGSNGHEEHTPIGCSSWHVSVAVAKTTPAGTADASAGITPAMTAERCRREWVHVREVHALRATGGAVSEMARVKAETNARLMQRAVAVGDITLRGQGAAGHTTTDTRQQSLSGRSPSPVVRGVDDEDDDHDDGLAADDDYDFDFAVDAEVVEPDEDDGMVRYEADSVRDSNQWATDDRTAAGGAAAAAASAGDTASAGAPEAVSPEAVSASGYHGENVEDGAGDDGDFDEGLGEHGGSEQQLGRPPGLYCELYILQRSLLVGGRPCYQLRWRRDEWLFYRPQEGEWWIGPKSLLSEPSMQRDGTRAKRAGLVRMWVADAAVTPDKIRGEWQACVKVSDDDDSIDDTDTTPQSPAPGESNVDSTTTNSKCMYVPAPLVRAQSNGRYCVKFRRRWREFQRARSIVRPGHGRRTARSSPEAEAEAVRRNRRRVREPEPTQRRRLQLRWLRQRQILRTEEINATAVVGMTASTQLLQAAWVRKKEKAAKEIAAAATADTGNEPEAKTANKPTAILPTSPVMLQLGGAEATAAGDCMGTYALVGVLLAATAEGARSTSAGADGADGADGAGAGAVSAVCGRPVFKCAKAKKAKKGGWFLYYHCEEKNEAAPPVVAAAMPQSTSSGERQEITTAPVSPIKGDAKERKAGGAKSKKKKDGKGEKKPIVNGNGWWVGKEKDVLSGRGGGILWAEDDAFSPLAISAQWRIAKSGGKLDFVKVLDVTIADPPPPKNDKDKKGKKGKKGKKKGV
jgi:hypothetical protein